MPNIHAKNTKKKSKNAKKNVKNARHFLKTKKNHLKTIFDIFLVQKRTIFYDFRQQKSSFSDDMMILDPKRSQIVSKHFFEAKNQQK